jgi:hypothetical protein
MVPTMSNEWVSAVAGRLLPTWAKSATGAQVVAIVAGILALASEVLMWRDVGYTLAVYASSANPVPERGYLLSFAPAGAGVLVAIVALTLRGRARWLHYPQIGLWLLALASSIYIAHVAAPVTGPGPLYGPLLVGDIPGVITIALLTLNLRRPARWHAAFALVAAAVPCLVAACSGPTYGPGSGTLIGIVTRCTLAEDKAGGWRPDPARFLTVSAQNQAGRTIASQRLPLRTSGARYRMRLLAGMYSISVISGSGDSSYSDYGATVTAAQESELDFKSWSCLG